MILHYISNFNLNINIDTISSTVPLEVNIKVDVLPINITK